MNSTLALISGLGLGLGLETFGLGLGLETPGLVNIPGQFPLFLMGLLTRPCRSGRIGCTTDRSCPVTEQPGYLVPHSC